VPDHGRVGALITEHHTILRDILDISTPKIESMIEAALSAGACGAKINGSGGGGCMFAYAPRETEKVKNAVGRFGKACIVRTDFGSRRE
jgi:galactokinase